VAVVASLLACCLLPHHGCVSTDYPRATAGGTSIHLTLLSSASSRPQCSLTELYQAMLSSSSPSPDAVSACDLSPSSRQIPSLVRDIDLCTPSDRIRLSAIPPTASPWPI